MLADLIDAVQHNTYAFVAANSKRKPKVPTPYERPTKKAKQKVSLFAAMARRHYKNRKS